MMKNNHNLFIRTINGLAHAFNKAYWDMADTSFKEELCITYIEENNVPADEAKKMLYKCGISIRNNPIVYLWLNKHIEQNMGMYTGITDYGKKKLISFRGF